MIKKYVRIRNRNPFLRKLLKLYGVNGKFRCYWCWIPLSIKKVTIDHYIPLSEGGPPFHIGNLVPSCKECNNWRTNNKEAFENKMKRIKFYENRQVSRKVK